VAVVYTLSPHDTVIVRPSTRWASQIVQIQDADDLVVKEGMVIQKGDTLATIGKYIEQISLNRQELENTKQALANEDIVQAEKRKKLALEEMELTGALQQTEQELRDVQHELQRGRATKSEAEGKANRVQALQADLKGVALRQKQAEVEYREHVAALNLKIREIHAKISELERKAYYRAEWNGKIHRIITKPLQNHIEVTLFYEPLEDTNASR
jgi:multidrug resistance efflux pump